MALELQDLPTIKVHLEVHCFLKAYAQVHDKEINAVVREIIHEWTAAHVHVMSIADKFAKAKELSGITGDWK